MSPADILSILARDSQDGDKCTFETCSIEDSWYGYRPSLPANAVLVGIFGFSLLCYLVQAVLGRRRFIGFSIAIIIGTFGEVVGYVGRVMMYNNPWKETPFMIQICCLTVAPAFLAAAIYFTLSRVVAVFGVANSRIGAKWYPRIFIPCDVVSLTLQAAGGGIASSAADGSANLDTGNNLMLAGLAFQVATLAVFIALATDFGVRTWLRMRALGSDAFDPRHQRLRASWGFRGFLLALATATLTIFIRSVYRVAELSGGWNGHLMKEEGSFIALESVMIAISVLVLNAFHPSFCFKEGDDKNANLEMK